MLYGFLTGRTNFQPSLDAVQLGAMCKELAVQVHD